MGHNDNCCSSVSGGKDCWAGREALARQQPTTAHLHEQLVQWQRSSLAANAMQKAPEADFGDVASPAARHPTAGAAGAVFQPKLGLEIFIPAMKDTDQDLYDTKRMHCVRKYLFSACFCLLPGQMPLQSHVCA
jgi:hypothetical protein